MLYNYIKILIAIQIIFKKLEEIKRKIDEDYDMVTRCEEGAHETYDARGTSSVSYSVGNRYSYQDERDGGRV